MDRRGYLQEDCFVDTISIYSKVMYGYVIYLVQIPGTCGSASTISTQKIVGSFPMHVSFPLFLYFYKIVFIYIYNPVSIFLFSMIKLEKQPAPLTTCPASKQVMSPRCVAMVSCYSAAASMRKLHITRGSGAPGRQGWPDLHGELDGSVDGARRFLKQVETVISYISNKI